MDSEQQTNRFCPKTLRLSRSFPFSSSLSVQRWKEEVNDHIPSLLPPTSTSTHRLRTRSLDRKSSSNFISTRRKSETGSSSSNSDQIQRHQAGFHSHIPIERTALSVLPSSSSSTNSSSNSNRRRRPCSIDWTPATQTAQPIIPSTTSATCSHGSPHSTLATSIGSPPSTRPKYQPKPLLLSSFGSKNIKRIPPTLEYRPNNLKSLDTPIVLKEDRKLAKRKAKQLELSDQLSIPEADESDAWSWLSCSDLETHSGSDSEEEMAVVWRASLDIGRRVNKDRKAYGKGHGIIPPQKPASTTPHQPTRSLLSPLNILASLFTKNRQSLTPVVFGSGLISGIMCSSLVSSTLLINSTRLLLPLSSSTGIGFFFNLIFSSLNNSASINPGLGSLLSPGTIGTSFGICAQWS
ncbi:hypothetical protein MJO28_006185 [Puccinia striiformis f. sp. tritici]|uniref:Uncharacterized protein n=1 Tax=Puccinia striiformis f. sp. tritici TaxID=168172 RepID=A0ACC0EIJ5_9BASI|nr:hypothetical protein MJO28_006185 [Puccinia striiformis f. sp. tritici]